MNQTDITFDSVVEELRNILQRTYGSVDSISTATPQMNTAVIAGVTYIYGVMSWNVTTTDRWGVAVLAPREQIFGDIDRANKDAIIVVVVVTLGVVLIIGGVMWWIVTPLSTLAQAMKRLTVFDFAALQEGKLLDVRSFVAEISYIQETFGTMVRAFAGGIRTNKLLVNSDTQENTNPPKRSKSGILGTPEVRVN
ncbi:hypothetical protein HK102_013446 [Quaeritorhiza haematococci]|nr:hypothetical protein HK102_013446 [Quaeritorhiza haematococci]